MATEKITLTEKLRYDITLRRKRLGISSYELSEKVGNGHSKYWLQNIESGKTQKISKNDLIKIYMILEKTDNEDDVIYDIENILNQNIDGYRRHWYELIDISEEYSTIDDDDELMNRLDDLLEDELIPRIRDNIFGMTTRQKQAALTAMQHLYFSLYKNSDLAFALLGIPVYGVSFSDKSEIMQAMNDLLAMYSKFNNLSIKNKSMETIKAWKQYDEYYQQLSKEWIHTAYENFQKIISELYDQIHVDSPDFYPLVRRLKKEVSFLIEQGQPNVLKYYLKSFQIHSGKEFVIHLKECVKWFMGFQYEYDLPYIFDSIDKNKYDEICKYLNNYGDIDSPPLYVS